MVWQSILQTRTSDREDTVADGYTADYQRWRLCERRLMSHLDCSVIWLAGSPCCVLHWMYWRMYSLCRVPCSFSQQCANCASSFIHSNFLSYQPPRSMRYMYSLVHELPPTVIWHQRMIRYTVIKRL